MVKGVASSSVTVFIPVKHFHTGYLRQAVASVFSQTRPDWRLLIVGHPSSETRTREVLAAELADPRVEMIIADTDRLAGAYNAAMRSAGTEFLTPLLGDDMFAPTAVEVLGEYIESYPNADFFHAGRYFIDGEGRRLSSDYLPRETFAVEDFWKSSPVKHLLCWRRSTGLACGGVDETLDNFASDDWDFPWTMFEHGAKFVPIHRALYVVRDHRDAYRLTTHVTRDVQIRTFRRILEKHGTPARVVSERVRLAKRGFLKQSLYRNPLHRWIRERLGFDASTGWRERYR